MLEMLLIIILSPLALFAGIISLGLIWAIIEAVSKRIDKKE